MSAAGHGTQSWGVPLLAVYGSALRMSDAYDRALQALVTAIEVTEPTGDRSAMGDLLQRLAFVVAGRRADYRRALALAEQATDHHFMAGDLNSAGKTLVDRGKWLYKLGRLDEAMEAQRRALECLDDVEYQNRCTALHGLGLYHRELGDLESARGYALRARELGPHIGPWLVAKLLWLEARIAVDRRRLAEAEALLRETIAGFTPISVEAAAQATTELVRVLLLQDRREAAYDTALTMVGLMIPLQDASEAAAAAVMDLLRCAQAGRGLELELVERVAADLEDERARPRGRARSGRRIP